MAGDRRDTAFDRGKRRGDPEHRVRSAGRRRNRIRLILASTSTSRRTMLEAAGVRFEAIASGVDEDGAKPSLIADGLSPRDLADALAELKAVKVSRAHPEALVLGCDQVAALDDRIFDKPGSREEAAEQLRALRSHRHAQHSAAVICEGGRPVWRQVDTAHLTVRNFSEEFLAAYLDAEWPAIGGCAGAYRLEAMGAQLFVRVDGSGFTVRGLPLLPLLEYLRDRGVMTR